MAEIALQTIPKLHRRRALLQGVSVGALLLASPQGRAAPFRSLAQALAANHALPTVAAPVTGIVAARTAQLGVQNFAAAAARFQSLGQALSRIAASSQAVADGLAPGGLQILTATGAATPVQAPGTFDVTVDQTQPLAQLSWKTFNIGAHTKLTFDQSAGGAQASNWVVINTVLNPAANPTQILGTISAPGKVYILDRNGIAFGAGATINVGALVAATADIAQTQFGTDATGLPTFSLYGTQSGSGFVPTFIAGTTAAITVAAGASITTSATSGGQGGSVFLLGGNVANAGIVNTPLGQTVLAAGTQFTVRQGSQNSVAAGNTISTTLGSEVAALNVPVASPAGTPAAFTTGAVANSGIVMADQGDISLVGQAITQSGVLLSTTTVNTRGTIHLLNPTALTDPGTATASIVLAPGSVTEILPQDNGGTALDSQRAANIAASATLNTQRVALAAASAINPQLSDFSALPDQLGESRIQISSGGTAILQPGSLALTPGGQVVVAAAGRVLLEGGATIDVSGSTSAVLPTSANDLLVNVQPYQLRDSAANRTGGLKSTNVNIDARTLVEIASGAFGPTATNPLGNIYTPGGLFEVGGYLGLVPHGIGEWTAIGGQVTLQSNGSVAGGPGEVATDAGSVINLTGGSVAYAAGQMPQSYVQTNAGQIFNANTAPGNLVYAGVYTGQAFAQPRWRVTDTYVNPLLTPPTTFDPGYTVGRDAGSLTVSAGSAALQGSIAGGVTLGQNQTGARPAQVSDPYLLAQTVVPLAGALQIGDYATGVLVGGIAAPVIFAAPGTPAAIGIVQIDTGMLTASSLARVAVTTTGTIAVDAPIAVADGGAVSLNAVVVDANAGITARGGTITLSNLLPGTNLPLVPPAGGVPPAIVLPAINLAAGALLDARGVWTNAPRTAQDIAGEALVNGGAVTVQGVGAVDLVPGSAIDVSSGGAVLSTYRTLAGRGGTVAITADLDTSSLPLGIGTGAVVFGATVSGVGSKGGGSFSLTVPNIVIGAGPLSPAGPPPLTTVLLGTQLFQSGFASYTIDGTASMAVLPGAQITVAEPIYVAGGSIVPTGGDPSSAYTVVLPPLFTPVRGGDTAAQRGGASISLVSDTALGNATGLGGPVTIGAGAVIAVDPGQSIVVAGRGQVTLDGSLIAPGGTVEVASTLTNTYLHTDPGGSTPSNYVPGASVWLDAASRIDVSGQADVFIDPLGRRFGSVSAGGTIELGGYGGLGSPLSTLAQVIERPGAVLDANGAAATFDVVPTDASGGVSPKSTSTAVASAGGTLVARSIAGIALDGSFTAQPGGPNAAGGSLFMRIDPIDLPTYNNLPPGLYQASRIVVTQAAQAVQPATLAVGQPTADTTFALGQISQAQIAAGGFDQVNLYGADFVTFSGDVALAAGRSITLSSSVIGAAAYAGQVSITAPYVQLAGYAGFPGISGGNATVNPAAAGATLSVQADLLDFQDALNLGGIVNLGQLVLPSGMTLPPVLANDFGFAQANLSSTGDVRFLGRTGNQPAFLQSGGNLTFRAGQIAPVSGQGSAVYAGVNPVFAAGVNSLAGGSITILGPGGTAPAAPYSVGGSLAFVAATVVQDGVVRAPQGNLRFGASSNDVQVLGNVEPTALTNAVTFGAGSVTSVSMAGQVIPFGGTVDGVNYLLPANTGLTASVPQPLLEVDSQSVAVASGAAIDLRGGGTLAGAGFTAGRGGSADVLRTPLLSLSGGAAVALGLAQTEAVVPAGLADPVYAILPGYQSAYAPPSTPATSGTSVPALGEYVTIGNEVPGLAAGTYTLLPATYALLPGAFRVELTSVSQVIGTAAALGNFSVSASVITGIANSGVTGQLPQAAIFTSGANVRQLSQYNEESYNAFAAATGTQFGAPRPVLPQDAKTLLLNFPSAGTLTALSIDPSAILRTPDPVAGGYGLTVEVTSAAPIDILGATDVAGTGAVALNAAALSALGAPRLLIGGTIFTTLGSDTAQITGTGPGVTVMPNAVLQAGDVMLATSGNGNGLSGTITVAGGATITTIGAGPAAFDLSNGFYFANTSNVSSSPVIDVSNGHDVFLPNTTAVAGAAINVDAGASLLAGGSLSFLAPSGTSVGIGAATLGGKYVSIAVGDINIGSLPGGSLNGLPTGLDLSAASLTALLTGNAAAGVPPASQLTLTATQEVNILGSVSLDSLSTALVLNTPAIYGYGGPNDLAQITAPSFTWSGISTTVPFALVNTVSALPGGQIAGSDGHVTGALAINAGTITLGYGPQTQPNGAALDRLLAGFTNVTMTATGEITANHQSTLSVYQKLAQYGQPGTNGNLTLDAPLITTDAAALLKITAGGALTLASPSSPSATSGVTTLGGEIDLLAKSIADNTAIALPAGRLTLTAQDSVALGGAANIDLSGRLTRLFDQVAVSPAGTLAVESTTGNITQAAGSTIDVAAASPTQGSAGTASFSALAGAVALDGAMSGAAANPASSGSLSVITGTLPSFDALNTTLDTGGFFGGRSFEVATGDILIDTIVRAHTVSVSADSGSVVITGRVDASGTTPGSIALSAGQNLTLANGASLDAHATRTVLDSYGQPIDAENRAHVTLTATAGTLALAGGSIDVSYPGQGIADVLHPNGNLQGQVTLNAPRLDATGAGGTTAGRSYGDVALSVTGTPAIAGAASIALYAMDTYVPTDPLGTIGQDNGPLTPAGATVTLAQIDGDNAAFIGGFAGIGAQKLGGLTSYGGAFHVRPGVIIDSSAATHGNLTITGDLDFSAMRYDAGAGYGTAKTGVIGSGEPGSIVFRATNHLVVNGSVSDGFAPPPDGNKGAIIPADAGWVFYGGNADPLGSDVVLPSSLTTTITTKNGTIVIGHKIELAGNSSGSATTFDTTRAISLNYDITISTATISAGTVIPFAVALGGPATAIPAGGWIATAPITNTRGVVLFRAGEVIPGGRILGTGDVLGAGTVLPVQISTRAGTVVPAGTPLNVFFGGVSLFAATAPLPDDALIPAGAVPYFVTPSGKAIKTLDLRPVQTIGKDSVQGRTYPLAALLPAGSLSWDMSFVAGADQASADLQAVTPRTVLDHGALAVPANTPGAGNGSLILDDTHYFTPSVSSGEPAFSVIRTGTGDLSLVAGGDFSQLSLYGIYTAGTQTSLGSKKADAPYQTQRNYLGATPKQVLPGNGKTATTLNRFINRDYAAYYANGGGDVRVLAQGSITGDELALSNNSASATGPSGSVGNWLWRQGGSGLGQLGAWWINYGTVVDSVATGSFVLTGFQGIGTLGGGNVSLQSGGDAGGITNRQSAPSLNAPSSEGLIIAVGGTGRVLASGGVVLTGGGSETVRIGGALNPQDLTGGQGDASNGDFVNLRGDIVLSAGSIGTVQPQYSSFSTPYDPRALNPFQPDYNGALSIVSAGGPNVVPGDATVQINTMRDLVLGGAGDPGRVVEVSTTFVKKAQLKQRRQSSTGGQTSFSLWTPATSISLFSAGGNVTPTTQPESGLLSNFGANTNAPLNDVSTDFRFIYPANLLVTAATGSIVYGLNGGLNNSYGLETAPSPTGQVAFLAGTSIFANGFAIDMSGAPLANLSAPLDPAYYVLTTAGGASTKRKLITNINANGATNNNSYLGLFSLEADTPTGNLHAADTTPELFYAAGGDIVNLVAGQTLTFPASYTVVQPNWYLAAKPVRIMASEDVVSSGSRPDTAQQNVQQNQQVLQQYGAVAPSASGDLFLNMSAQSISSVSAGRDILSGYFYVGGPGLLEVDAGRNLFQGGYSSSTAQLLDFGAIRSLGPLLSGTQTGTTGGADLAVLAGIGTAVDYSAFANLYFNPANQANLALPITDPANAGKVQLVYTSQLAAWLAANYPGLSLANGALAALNTLPQVDQNIFVRSVFFQETLASGRQYNDTASRFFGSYTRGRLAIDTLFPSPPHTEVTPGVPVGYSGAVTMLSGPVGLVEDAAGVPLTFDAGISTQSGGTVQVLDPGGQVLLGTPAGVAPGGGSGIIGNGAGGIDIYANNSVLLGQSRIFTTGGGSIFAWSSQGDINAGIGARTTVEYAPPLITYATTGGLSETASAPTNGAGIATLQPLPGIPPGNIDLVAPLGTIDAGEAGIRVAGNLNLAAARLANTANITVGGKTSGNASAPSVSLGAVEAAGAAAGAASNAAQNTDRPRASQEQPSVIEVEVVGVGDSEDDLRKRRHKS